MARTSRSGNLFVIDVSPLRALARAARKASPEMARELRTGLRKGAEIVADDARARAASAKMPKSIAESIRTRSAGIRTSVVAGNPKAPAAAAFENKGFPGEFRHPLFGNKDYWYKQAAHPYLRPAAEMNAPKVAEAVLDGVSEVIDRALSEASNT